MTRVFLYSLIHYSSVMNEHPLKHLIIPKNKGCLELSNYSQRSQCFKLGVFFIRLFQIRLYCFNYKDFYLKSIVLDQFICFSDVCNTVWYSSSAKVGQVRLWGERPRSLCQAKSGFPHRFKYYPHSS